MSSPDRPKANTPTRQHMRYAAYRELSIVYEGYSQDIQVRAPDLGVRGMFINTARQFPEGAVVNIRFRLTHTNVLVNVRGEVRYCLPDVGIGIEFVEISPEAQRAIEEELSSVDVAPPSAP